MDQILIITLNRDGNNSGPSRSEILEDLRVIGMIEVIDYNVDATVSEWFRDKYPDVNVDDLLIVRTRYTDPYYVEKAMSTLNDIDVGYRMLYDSEVNGLYDEDGVYDVHGLKDNLIEALTTEYELFKSRNPEAAAEFVKRMHDDFGSSKSTNKSKELNKLADDICDVLYASTPTDLSGNDADRLEDQLDVIRDRILDEDSDVILTGILNILSRMDQDFWVDYAMLVVLE